MGRKAWMEKGMKMTNIKKHISCLRNEYIEDAIKVLKMYFDPKEYVFRVENFGFDNSDILCDDITEQDSELATAICFGFHFAKEK